jgi:hypothetical protein
MRKCTWILLLMRLPLSMIQDYANTVDAVGLPHIETFGQLKASCTCLRYLYHALQILDHLGDEREIVEVGGGYGGLVVAFSAILKHYNIDTFLYYTIVDLPGPLKLQADYTRQFQLDDICLNFMNCSDYGANVHGPAFLVSNYCLAEMGRTIEISILRH